MEKIELDNVSPRVFSGRVDMQSEVWRQKLTLSRGRNYLVEAASGTGKSSLCSYLYGYRADYEGEILFDGRDIRTISPVEWGEIRRTRLSIVWQELRLFPELTAIDNVRIKNNLTRHQTEARIDSWFERLGIAGKRQVPAGRMSYGQQQRVALIRALCQPFDFILVDEPVSHLDDQNAAAVASILSEEAARNGASVIATSIGRRLPLCYQQSLKL